jgi:gamma-glutamyltranspeptidase / glutathione hydrolase
LTQIALNAGAAYSYAGIMNAVYYDAASDKVYTLNCQLQYCAVQNEKEPSTIPRREPSGRTAMVPGFMAGVQALHERFGKLSFSALFAPAIWVAENGVPLNAKVAERLREQEKVVTRLREAKSVLSNTNGEIYKAGELFRHNVVRQDLPWR